MSELAFAARHSMDSPEWYTPTPFVESARVVMSGIDLDPASHEEANARIQATRFYDEIADGLTFAWNGRLFVNPPGGKVAAFWLHLMRDFYAGRVKQAVWIGYSLEQLQTLQQCGAPQTPLDFPICVTARRIAFVENEAKRAERVAKLIAQGKKPNAKSSPSHSNYITYMGPNVREFTREFCQYGQVVVR